MNRIQNHRQGGVASVYDRHAYLDETKHLMTSVAAHVMDLVGPTRQQRRFVCLDCGPSHLSECVDLIGDLLSAGQRWDR